ncbi:MAG: metal ABC transporter ATP-binding protein [Acidimicrobiia bacterium]
MPVTPAVKATNVELRYGSTVAVASSSFDIPAGRITVLIGPNGSGKSTLLNGIAGLMRTSSGSLQVAAALAEPAPAYVLQTTKVNEALPVTVREVVTMGRYTATGPHGRLRDSDRRAVQRAMARMGITGLAGSQLHELSGGQRQRVFVAQGLAQEHPMLLLDEPLTGLDLPSALAIDEVIHDERNRATTVVMSTHDLAEAMAADHVILLSKRVVAWGPPEAALTATNLTAAYGASLLHLEGDSVFIDDPAHRPVPGRHHHRERIIHIEPSASDAHGGEPGGDHQAR